MMLSMNVFASKSLLYETVIPSFASIGAVALGVEGWSGVTRELGGTLDLIQHGEAGHG